MASKSESIEANDTTKEDVPEVGVIESREDDQAGASEQKAATETQESDADLKKAVQTLKEQLDAERRAKAEAERRANEAQNLAFRAGNEVADTNLRLIDNAIHTLKSESATLKAAYAQAMQAQDFERAAETQEAMAGNAARLLQLENGREAIAAQPKRAPPEPVVSDPMEAVISHYNISGRSAQWLRTHPELANQRDMNAVFGAHNVAVQKHRADSDEYFAEVERILGMGRRQTFAETDDDEGPLSDAAEPIVRRSSPPATPVSRTSGTNGGRPRVIRLSKEEAEMAKMTGQTEQQYYENKQALAREGRLN